MAQEAIAGLSGEFKLPKEFADKLYDYQSAAVQIAAHHLNKRGGVLLGDVGGLGKTLMAAAIAKIFQEDHNTNALILCPPNLAEMWRNVIQDYGLIGDVLSTSRVIQDDYLKNLRRYRLVIIDESHNLRNAEGRRYAAIRDYIADNDCKVILLSATPYNKTYLDLAAQLGLFISDNRDLGVRPEAYLRDLGGEAVFMSKHQTTVRTCSFITTHYAELDPTNGRKYIQNRDGVRSYFPIRVPKTVKYEANPQYRRLYDDLVVDTINGLSLPRHGLSLYVSPDAEAIATISEKTLIQNLSRAGQRLIGFTRTGLFKRLESSGSSFLQSLDRHVLRNYVFLHALKNGFNLPIGTLDIQEERDEDIVCYSFLPADGVEQLIRLRARVRQRLSENGEVIGSDEEFFEDESQSRHLKDLYTEKSGIMDEEANDNDVDLASEAYQIWESATKHNKALRHKIEGLPDVVYSTRAYTPTLIRPVGVITYIKSATGADALTWMGADSQPVIPVTSRHPAGSRLSSRHSRNGAS